MRGVVDGGRLDDLVLVEQRIGDEGDPGARLPVQKVVADHAVPGGRDAGHQRRVIGPGDGREGALQPFGPGAVFGQLAERGQIGPRIIEIKAG